MANIDIKARQINCKLVYYGTGLGGKTTNLRYIHEKTNPTQRGNQPISSGTPASKPALVIS